MLSNSMSDGSTALALSFSKWRLGTYYRISKDDKRAGESVSISNQRALIEDYIKQIDEFAGADVIEYVDDGLSGATTDREAYKKMMQDIENGMINCIIVKDLSRIGRNMLETDELLMVYLVERNVRFISLGDRYDSFVQPLSVLELATINLFNQDHIRDLAQKSLSRDTKKTLEGRIMAERKAVKTLENSITKIFTSMVSGDMSTEAFLGKKEVINTSIGRKNAIIEKLETRLAALTTGKAASEEVVARLYAYRSLEVLDRDVVDCLISRILIHGDKDIEIVWNDCVG